METPNTSVGYLLENLTDEEKRKENQLFAELYSWYLNSPDYCTMTKKLTEAAFLRKPVDQISKSVAKALYGEISPNGATRLERFFCMCICTFSEIWTLNLRNGQNTSFGAMDMGNIIHQALEEFAVELLAKTTELARAL